MKTDNVIPILLTLDEVLRSKLINNLEKIKQMTQYDPGKGTQHFF